jgi:hypothetical protein
MSLEKLDKKMADLKVLANKNLEEIPASVRGAWSTAVRNAKDELKDVQDEYRTLLLRNAVAILVGGDAVKAAELAALAKDEGGIVVDANALYTRLAQTIEPTLSDQRMWGVQQSHMLHKGLQEVMTELNLTELTMPARTPDVSVPTFDDVVEHVRVLIVDGIGNTLNALYVQDEAAKRAFEIRYIGTTAPVLVVNAREKEAAAIAKGFGKGDASMTVNSEDEINKDYLTKALKKLRKK